MCSVFLALLKGKEIRTTKCESREDPKSEKNTKKIHRELGRTEKREIDVERSTPIV